MRSSSIRVTVADARQETQFLFRQGVPALVQDFVEQLVEPAFLGIARLLFALQPGCEASLPEALQPVQLRGRRWRRLLAFEAGESFREIVAHGRHLLGSPVEQYELMPALHEDDQRQARR